MLAHVHFNTLVFTHSPSPSPHGSPLAPCPSPLAPRLTPWPSSTHRVRARRRSSRRAARRRSPGRRARRRRAPPLRRPPVATWARPPPRPIAHPSPRLPDGRYIRCKHSVRAHPCHVSCTGHRHRHRHRHRRGRGRGRSARRARGAPGCRPHPPPSTPTPTPTPSALGPAAALGPRPRRHHRDAARHRVAARHGPRPRIRAGAVHLPGSDSRTADCRRGIGRRRGLPAGPCGAIIEQPARRCSRVVVVVVSACDSCACDSCAGRAPCDLLGIRWQRNGAARPLRRCVWGDGGGRRLRRGSAARRGLREPSSVILWRDRHQTAHGRSPVHRCRCKACELLRFVGQ